MTLLETTPVLRHRRTAARVVSGRAVVIVIDRQELHSLDEVGTRIWELSDGRSLGAIVDALVDEFEVDRPTALADAEVFVADLAARGALLLEGAA